MYFKNITSDYIPISIGQYKLGNENKSPLVISAGPVNSPASTFRINPDQIYFALEQLQDLLNARRIIVTEVEINDVYTFIDTTGFVDFSAGIHLVPKWSISIQGNQDLQSKFFVGNFISIVPAFYCLIYDVSGNITVANSSTLVSTRVVGITIENVNPGPGRVFLGKEVITNSGWAFLPINIGKFAFLTISGTVTDIIPTTGVVKPVGVVTSVRSIFFDPTISISVGLS